MSCKLSQYCTKEQKFCFVLSHHKLLLDVRTKCMIVSAEVTDDSLYHKIILVEVRCVSLPLLIFVSYVLICHIVVHLKAVTLLVSFSRCCAMMMATAGSGQHYLSKIAYLNISKKGCSHFVCHLNRFSFTLEDAQAV